MTAARDPLRSRSERAPASTETKPAARTEIVDESSSNQRLDNYLLKTLKGVPKSHVYRVLRRGEVRVNGQRAQPDRRLVEGDQVRIPPVRGAAPASRASATHGSPADRLLQSCIVHEDDWLLVLDKPSGWAVHGGSGVSRGVIEQLRAERPQARFLELVHRLDRDTSGLLLVARKRSALTALHQALRDGAVDKHYSAIAHGTWRKGQRRVDAALRQTMAAPAEKRMVADEDGLPAATIFTPMRQWRGFSLLDARLLTGRTHQIRVHLAHVGHPILGDDKYGSRELDRPLARLGVRRLMLHAASLSFIHPGTGERVRFESPLPEAFNAFIERLDERDAEQRRLRSAEPHPDVPTP